MIFLIYCLSASTLCHALRLNSHLKEVTKIHTLKPISLARDSQIQTCCTTSNLPKIGRASVALKLKGDSESIDAVYNAMLANFLEPFSTIADIDERKTNLEKRIEDSLDMCEYNFLMYLNDRIGEVGPESEEGQHLKNIALEINTAMQRRLARADRNLRAILSHAPDLKKIEKSLGDVFRTGEADMAFIVTLNMNISQANEAGSKAENALAILKHLHTKLMELQDKRLPVAVQLMRRMLRAGREEYAALLTMNIMLSESDEGKVAADDLIAAIQEFKKQLHRLNEVSLEYQTDIGVDLDFMLLAVQEAVASFAVK